jgi:hypothetical protein
MDENDKANKTASLAAYAAARRAALDSILKK